MGRGNWLRIISAQYDIGRTSFEFEWRQTFPLVEMAGDQRNVRDDGILCLDQSG